MNISVNLIHHHFQYILESSSPQPFSIKSYCVFQPTWKTSQFSDASPPSRHSLHRNQAVGHSFEGCKPLEKFPFSSTNTARHQLAVIVNSDISLNLFQTHISFCILLIWWFKTNQALRVNSTIMLHSANQIVASNSIFQNTLKD